MTKRSAAFLVLVLCLVAPLLAQDQEPTRLLPSMPRKAARAHPHPANDPSRGAAPANDECADAISLTAGTECVPVTGSVLGATQTFAPSECDGETAVAAEDVYALDVNEIVDPSFTVCVFTPPPGYCLASSANTGFEVIQNVSIDDVVNASTDTIGYEDFTDIVAEISAGSSIVLVVSIENEYASDIVNAWADFDRNDQFEESEHIMNSEGESPHAADVPIPDGLSPGDIRLRIRVQDSDYDAVATPCFNTLYGQVEDYTLHVTDPGGFQEHVNAPWRLYPDPSNGDLVIVHQVGATRTTVQVLDMTGRLVYQEVRGMPAGSPVRFALRDKLTLGTYVVRVATGNAWHTQRYLQH